MNKEVNEGIEGKRRNLEAKEANYNHRGLEISVPRSAKYLWYKDITLV